MSRYTIFVSAEINVFVAMRDRIRLNKPFYKGVNRQLLKLNSLACICEGCGFDSYAQN